MIHRTLGRTGIEVSAIGLGGFHIGKPELSSKDAVQIVRAAIDGGITFIDDCWDYNEGESDRRYAKALKDGYRERAFLMSKIDGRDRKTAMNQIDESLKRLQVEHIDLMQHHEVIRFEDAHRIFAGDGAQRAMEDARKAGKIRFIGFTGHKDPHVHLNMLEVAARHGFTFDTVQMPLNVMDAHYRSFGALVLPELVKQNIGVLGMKSMGDGVILKAKAVSAVECLHYALNLPTSVVITGIDSMERLEQALGAADSFQPLTEERVREILARSAPHASAGKYEPFKTSTVYDSTAEHLEWLGEMPAEVKELTGQ
jgi:aryl-alcohol dehydrogenase-like predicted oxidoreductase